MVDRVLDWRPKPDLKSFGFMISGLSEFESGKTKNFVRRTKHNVFLDQGQEGACTGFGAENVMALGPNRIAEASNANAQKIYQEARRQDEWPGENYDGSSVNGAMKALKLFGLISDWHWCLSLAEIDYALSFVGAVEAGTHWYTGMFNPDSDGYLIPSGKIEGGHAYAISARRLMYNGRYKGHVRYRIENSWGEDWGLKGAAWILDEHMGQLLAEGGEYSCPTKIVS